MQLAFPRYFSFDWFMHEILYVVQKNCLLLGAKLLCVLAANRQWTARCGFVVPDAETE
jgi:hypothetical protein